MTFDKVFCLFEQSGTFKNAFKKIGHKAYDCDIVKTEHTNFTLDLFKEINDAKDGRKKTIFDLIKKDDLIMAFFPCTYFSDQSQLDSRGDSFSKKNWTLKEKLEYSSNLMIKRALAYKTLCNLCIIALEKNFKLIIENPTGNVGFLKQYFPIKTKIIINDRSLYGDDFKKSTQFFFVNCEPAFHLEEICKKNNNKIKKVEKLHTSERSIISSDFADIFIRNWVLE